MFLHHPSSLAHETGAHPERAARIVAIERELDGARLARLERVESPPVDARALTAVHRARMSS